MAREQAAGPIPDADRRRDEIRGLDERAQAAERLRQLDLVELALALPAVERRLAFLTRSR
jgi:hypothetical protein